MSLTELMGMLRAFWIIPWLVLLNNIFSKLGQGSDFKEDK